MPLPRQLYIPQGTGGQPRYTACSTASVPDSIEFDIGGVRLDVKLAAVTGGRHYIELRLEVPARKVATLLDDRITFVWADGRPRSDGNFERISLVDGPIINLRNPALRSHMIATNERMVGPRNFWLATFVTPQPDGDFMVVLPSISVDGSVVSLPQVGFRKGPLALLAPVNC